jgi:hypothetical protein
MSCGVGDAGGDGGGVDAVVEAGAALVHRGTLLREHLPDHASPLREPVLDVVFVFPGTVHELLALVEPQPRALLAPAVIQALDGEEVPEGAHHVGGEHVEEEVESGTGKGGLSEDPRGSLELGGDGVDADEAGHVLGEHDEEECRLDGEQVGALGAQEELDDLDLRQWEH